MTTKFGSKVVLLAGIIALALSPYAARAQTTYYWTNTSGTVTTPWGTPQNWTNGAPGAGGGATIQLSFSAGSGAYSASNDFAGAFTNNGLIFGAGAATLYGGQLVFTNNGTTRPVVTNYSGNTSTINNNLAFATNVTFSQTAASTTTVNGAISGVGALTNMGNGTLVLAGSAPNTPLTVRGGTVNLNGGSCSNVFVAPSANDNATLTIASGAQVYGSVNTLYVAQGAGSTGIVNQSGGVVNNGGSSPMFGYLGVGVFNLSGGTFSNVSSYVALGYGANSVGVFNQSGGVISMNAPIQMGRITGGSYGHYNLSGGNSTNSSVDVGNVGYGVFYQSGGTNIQGSGTGLLIGNGGTGVVYQTGGLSTFQLSRPVGLGWAISSRGECTIAGGTNIAGIAGNHYVYFNHVAGGTSVNTLNLNGGLLEAKAMYKENSGGMSVVNFNGGTFQASVSGTMMGPGVVAGSGFTNALDAAYVQSGGAVFDTQGFTVTNAQNLLAPTGYGVTAIPLANLISGYIGAPIVQLSGGGGTGATAVALMDFSGGIVGSVTGIVVTSAGSGYSSQPSVTLISGGIASTNLAAPATIGAVSSGGLVKLGSGTLCLSGANTFSGDTAIPVGTLVVGNALALQNSTLNYTIGTVKFDAGATAYTFGGLAGTQNIGLTNTAGTALTLTVGGNGHNTTYSGTLSKTGASLVKVGSGTLTLSGANTYDGVTTVSNGILNVNGSVAGSVTVVSGGGLSGTGTVSAVTVNSNATLRLTVGANGISDAMIVNGNLSISAGALFQVTNTNLLDGTYRYTVISNAGARTGSFTLPAGQLPPGWSLDERDAKVLRLVRGFSGMIIRIQ